MTDGTDSEPLFEPMDISDDFAEVTRPMVQELSVDSKPDVVEDTAMEIDQPQIATQHGEYIWKLKLDRQKEDRMHSPVFECGGYYWSLLCCPNGSEPRNRGNISLFLGVPDFDGAQGEVRKTHFEISLVNKDPNLTVSKGADKDFEDRGSDWGFGQFLDARQAFHSTSGFLVDNCLTIKVEMHVQSPDSVLEAAKKQTGFVGLKNQGATCYMNSLLQTLYNINIFRQAVYQMPIKEEEQAESSIPLALQTLFFKLQFGKHIVSTKSLTQSFGWTSMDAFTQHDVQELNKILSDRLENKMKGTPVEGTIGRLFEGKITNFIECINVDYTSSREEIYLDLSLSVKDCRNMYDSFDESIKMENLDGQNKYQAEGHGYQDARKGMLFDSFPPVLQIQLKRFDYDFATDNMVKINSRYEFPEVLDLDRDDYKYLSKNADRSVRNRFRLHSVLVHAGGIHGGHYFAFINPSGKQWIRFDDEKVTLVDKRHAMDDQFGTDDTNFMRASKISNAYMLVYIRESDWDSVMCEVGKEALQTHVRERLEREISEKERIQKEKSESHLYTQVRVATEEEMKKYIDAGNHFDLVDFSKIEGVKMRKFSKFREFREQQAAETGVPPDEQFYWNWAARQNGTYRPQQLYTDWEDGQFTTHLKDENANVNREAWMAHLNLFRLDPPPALKAELQRRKKAGQDANLRLVFWKEYLPREKKIKFLGCTIVDGLTTMQQTIPLLAKKDSSIKPDSNCSFWEEVQWREKIMITTVDNDCTFTGDDINTGDILIVQERLSQEEADTVEYPTVKEYLEHVRNRHEVTFKPLDAPQEEGFKLELSKEMDYDDVEKALAQALTEKGHVIPQSNFLRFTAQQVWNQIPKPQSLPYRKAAKLEQMLTQKYEASPDVLYYDILDIPLADFERMKVLKVRWHNSKGEPVKEHKLRVKKEADVGDLLKAVSAVEPEAANAKRLRLLETSDTKIFRVHYEDSTTTAEIFHDDSLRAEAIPEDDEAVEDGFDLPCCHVSINDGRRVMQFGDPVLIRVGKDDDMDSVAKRIQTRLGIKDEDFAKWEFRRLRGIMTSDSDIIQFDETVYDRFKADSGRIYLSGGFGPEYLGLQHAVTHSKRVTRHRGAQGITIQ